METVYIVEQGSQLHKDGYRLLVKKGDKVIDEVKTADLEQIILLGNVIITPPVIDHLIHERVDTVFLSLSGRFRGRLLTQFTKNVLLRQQQYIKFSDADFSLRFARALVVGKINNQRIFLMRHNRKLKDDDIAAAVGRMRIALEEAHGATSVNSLMGIEGMSGRAYFLVFNKLISNEDFVFNGRNRRPPRDPVNALLSFGYTMLANAVETAINIVGMDPYLGAFHSAEYGRPSLVCDLMEEFRAFFVDSLVITLLNKRIVTPQDFIYREVSESDGFLDEDEDRIPEDKLPVSMKRETLKGFVRIFEQKMATTVYYEPTGENLTYRQVIVNQVRQCARLLLGKQQEYKPFIWTH